MRAGRKWGHDDLQDDLARTRIACGEAVVQKLNLGFWGAAGQIDVWAQKLSRTRPKPVCYEVKVTRSDFLQDVRAGKHRRYEGWAERFYFATPSGLVDRREVPDGWGLIVRGDNGWSATKAAPVHRLPADHWKDIMVAVMLAYHPGPWARQDRAGRLSSISLKMEKYPKGVDAAKRFGVEVCKMAEELETVRRERDTLRARMVSVHREVCGFGLGDYDPEMYYEIIAALRAKGVEV